MIRSEADDIKKQLEELKKCGTIAISQMDDLKTELEDVQTESYELRTKISEMIQTVSQLNVNINGIDHSLREASIEIYGLPELKDEVLSITVILFASYVSDISLKDWDILKCIRLDKRIRPRPVLVKLRSARLRDELYAAVIRYNKAHPDDKFNTAVMRYTGKKMPIYVTEHRSPMSKS